MSASTTIAQADPFDARRAQRATGLLRAFNEIGLLSPADVHVATRIAELVGEESEPVRLATALAVRGPRLGHVFVDLATIRDTASIESEAPVDLSALPWPAAEQWIDVLAASELVAVGKKDPRGDRPLRLLETHVYLDRYWREERRVAADLQELAAGEPPDAQVDLPAEGLRRLFTGDSDLRQRLAAAAAVLRRFAVIAGGPNASWSSRLLLLSVANAVGEPAR